MSKARSVCKDWDFVTKGTELSVGGFLIEYFWLAAKSEAISTVRKRQGGAKGTEAPSPHEKEVGPMVGC
jgi:hypothetical protein